MVAQAPEYQVLIASLQKQKPATNYPAASSEVATACNIC